MPATKVPVLMLTVTCPPNASVPALIGAMVVLLTPSSSKVVAALVPSVSVLGGNWLAPETVIPSLVPLATVIAPVPV